MENQDILQTIAEVAIALVGFSGIVVTLGRRRTWNTGEILRLTAMLRASLSAMFLSFVPILMYQFFPTFDYWRISIALLTIVMSTNIILFQIRAKQVRQALTQKMLFYPGVAIAISCLLATFGFGEAKSFYILALVFMLFVGTNNFILLLIDSQVVAKESEQSVDEKLADR